MNLCFLDCLTGWLAIYFQIKSLFYIEFWSYCFLFFWYTGVAGASLILSHFSLWKLLFWILCSWNSQMWPHWFVVVVVVCLFFGLVWFYIVMGGPLIIPPNLSFCSSCSSARRGRRLQSSEGTQAQTAGPARLYWQKPAGYPEHTLPCLCWITLVLMSWRIPAIISKSQWVLPWLQSTRKPTSD